MVKKGKYKTILSAKWYLFRWDKYEIYGHSDGIVKPLSDTTVLMTNYQDYDKEYSKEVVKKVI